MNEAFEILQKKIQTREIEKVLIQSSDTLVVQISTAEKEAYAVGIPVVENSINSAISAALFELGLFEHRERVTGLISGPGRFL